MKPIKERCGAVHGFYVCELPPGHTCRHRERGFNWLDASVAAARASTKEETKICGATCPDENGGPDYICQLPPHKIFPGAKHRDDRGGLWMWTQAGADRIAPQLAAKRAESK